MIPPGKEEQACVRMFKEMAAKRDPLRFEDQKKLYYIHK